MKLFFSFLCSMFFIQMLAAEEEPAYAFSGKHLISSYMDCDQEALQDLDALLSAMDEAVEASGATILNRTFHVFPPSGITAVYLLSESHASIHTYPEHGACFVDLFTCGETCSAEKFDTIMRKYLKPKQISSKKFARGETTEEVYL